MARNLFKLMAIKDEYEVARLYSDGSFAHQIRDSFRELSSASNTTLRRRSLPGATRSSGRPLKSTYGPWMMSRLPICSRE